MIILRQKTYSKKGEIFRSIIPLASIGISSYNAISNYKKRKMDKEFQDKQLKYYEKLTRALNKNTEALEKDD